MFRRNEKHQEAKPNVLVRIMCKRLGVLATPTVNPDSTITEVCDGVTCYTEATPVIDSSCGVSLQNFPLCMLMENKVTGFIQLALKVLLCSINKCQ